MRVYDPHKTTTEVRGANRRLGNFRVLIISTVAIVLIFAVLFVVFAMNTPPSAISP